MDNVLNAIAQRIFSNINKNKSIPVKKVKAQERVLPTPTIDPRIPSEQAIEQGLRDFNPETPLATQSGVLRQAMIELSKNPQVDPMLPVLVALRESRGGLDLLNPDRQSQGLNNPYNVMNDGKLINYPDLKTAVLGGNNPEYGVKSKGFVGVMNSPAYQKYRETGNIDDFNATYSPPGHGNPTLEQQKRDLEALRKYFKNNK